MVKVIKMVSTNGNYYKHTFCGDSDKIKGSIHREIDDIKTHFGENEKVRLITIMNKRKE